MGRRKQGREGGAGDSAHSAQCAGGRLDVVEFCTTVRNIQDETRIVSCIRGGHTTMRVVHSF